MNTSSRGASWYGPWIRVLFTNVPLVDSRSMSVTSVPVNRIRACALETPGSGITRSFALVRPIVISRFSNTCVRGTSPDFETVMRSMGVGAREHDVETAGGKAIL